MLSICTSGFLAFLDTCFCGKFKMFWCAVPDCTSDSRKKGRYGYMRDIEFFPFPSEVRNLKLRKRWLSQIRRKNYYPSRVHRVCSLHFVDGRPTEANPVPTLFPRNNFGKPKKERNTSSITKRHFSTQVEECSTGVTNAVNSTSSDPGEIDVEVQMPNLPPVVRTETVSITHFVDCALDMDHACVSISGSVSDDHSYSNLLTADPPDHKDQSIQTDLSMVDIAKMEERSKNVDVDRNGLLRDLFVRKVTESDENVQSYTGVPTKAMLDGLFGVLDKVSPTLNYWSGPISSNEKPYQENPRRKKSGPQRKLSRYQEFLLTLIKLRLAVFTFCLADVFCVSNARVSQIFSTWINFMYIVFTPLLKWPSSKRIKKYLPKSFKVLYPRTTCIIDCTEIFIEKPASPTAQALTYSSYKHRNTYKLLVSISPTGAFIFVSDLWGGNTSDRFITSESGFLDHIKPGDEVMADRGFVIRDLLLERRALLIIPPFTRKCSWGKGKRLNSNEIKKTKNIARLRIHVERAIGCLKKFHILSGTMPLTLKPLANQIVKVCAFLCNLQKPLIKE